MESTKRQLSKRGKKPSTYGRIVTGNVNGTAIVQSDEPLLAYGQRGGEIRVGLRADTEFCEITVSDDGAGIPQEYLNDLGSKRITFKGGANRGVGLVHAFKTIKTWDGKIAIESKVGLGTRIKLKLFVYVETTGVHHGGDELEFKYKSLDSIRHHQHLARTKSDKLK
jgi:Histidine kinase-, DNA gyrase B-, and HSP90-like ATPase